MPHNFNLHTQSPLGPFNGTIVGCSPYDPVFNLYNQQKPQRDHIFEYFARRVRYHPIKVQEITQKPKLRLHMEEWILTTQHVNNYVLNYA